MAGRREMVVGETLDGAPAAAPGKGGSLGGCSDRARPAADQSRCAHHAAGMSARRMPVPCGCGVLRCHAAAAVTPH
jgi:hypothetical protein